MDTTLREIQWLKRLMTELGDDRTSLKEDSAAVRTKPPMEVDEDDDSDLDRLLHRAMVLLRGRASNNQLHVASERADDAKQQQTLVEEEEDDGELDELLRRALKLLRERVDTSTQCISNVNIKKETDSTVLAEHEDDDDELDQLLRRAMMLFAERRQRSLNNEKSDVAATAELDVVWLKTIQPLTQMASPGSPGFTDGEDEEEEEDEELDELLHRATALLRQRLQAPVSNQHHVVPVLKREDRSMDCIRQCKEELRKRPRDGDTGLPPARKLKRARCLVEFQQDSHTEELQTEVLQDGITRQWLSSEAALSTTESAPPQFVESTPTIEPTNLVNLSDSEAQTLRADNAKLVTENAQLRQQLQANKSSDARMVQLLQDQVQRLQQQQLELMRELAQCSS